MAELIDRVDVVYHLAAAVGVQLIVESPVNTIETNVHGTEMVLKLANKKKKKVLIASTSEVYGKSEDVPFREDADLVLGRHHQGALELRLQQGHRRVPGPRLLEGEAAAGGGLPPLQHRGPAADRPLRHGDPQLREAGAAAASPSPSTATARQSRCFTYVSDVVDALVKLAEHPGAVGQVFNIGNDHEEITILDLAQRVKARTGSQQRDRDGPLRQGLRGGLRGHAAARARPRARSAPCIGYEPQGAPRRDPRPGHRVLQVGQGAGLTGERTPLLRHLGKLASHSAVYGAADVFTSRRQPPPHPALHRRTSAPPSTGTSRCCCCSAPRPRSCSGSASTPASSACTTTWTTDAERRRLAGTVALFAAAAGVRALGAVVAAARARSRARSSAPGAPEGWVVLVAADVFLGTFAFVPLSLLRIQDRPGLFSALSVVRHTVNIALKVVLVIGGLRRRGRPVERPRRHRRLRARPAAHPPAPRGARVLRRRCCATCWPSALPKVPHGLMVQVAEPGRPQDPRPLRDAAPRSGSTTWATPSAAG